MKFISDGVGVSLGSLESTSAKAGLAGRIHPPLVAVRVSPIVLVGLTWMFRPPPLEIRNSDHGGIGIVGRLWRVGVVVVGSVAGIRPIPMHIGNCWRRIHDIDRPHVAANGRVTAAVVGKSLYAIGRAFPNLIAGWAGHRCRLGRRGGCRSGR